ncbi:MAG: hypothetical protein R6U50_07585 [Desulfobacterales bacterium]
MNREGILIMERIDEVSKMCEREQPIYEQISSFSIALYVLGHFECADLLSADDVDNVSAGTILKQHFQKVEKNELPTDYHICTSDDKYLLVIGDPAFPTHFAVVADIQGKQPYFSKLPFFGSGFDSLSELENEFIGIDGLTTDDIAYYKFISKADASLSREDGRESQKKTSAKIYTVKEDGNYSVLEYHYAT